MLRLTDRITSFFLMLLVATAAGAAERDPEAGSDSGEEPKSYSWGLGLAGISQQQVYAGMDRDNIAIPLVYFENRWVQLIGPWFGLKLPGFEWGDEHELELTLRAQLFGFDGYEPDDAPILNGMGERKNGIFAGPAFRWSNPIAEVFGEWMFDTSGNSNGQRVSIGLERKFHLGNHFIFTPSATATWLDKKYADYYYGVRVAESRADRSVYVGDDAVNAEFSLRTDYLFDQHRLVFLQMGYTAFASEIKDSPLTDRSSETMLIVGYLYRF